MKSGNYNAVLQMFEDTTNYMGKTNEETKNKLDARLSMLKQHLSDLKENNMGYNKEQLDAEIEKTNELIQETERQQKEINAKISTGQSKIKNTWNKALSDQLSEITGHNIKFQKTANGNIQAYIDGQKQGAPMTKKEAKKMAEEMKSELAKAKSGSKQAGVDFTTGTTQGIKQGQGGTFDAVKKYGNNILQSLKNALKEHSPSKATKEMGINFDKGFEQGVEAEKDNSLKTIKNYGQDMLDELDGVYNDMQNAIDMETGKMTANVQTSGTYQMAMAGVPTFNLQDNSENTTQLVVSGKVLAEVVNTENRNREVAKA